MAEVGRDLWRSSGSNTLLKQGHLEQVVQDHVQTASEYLQDISVSLFLLSGATEVSQDPAGMHKCSVFRCKISGGLYVILWGWGVPLLLSSVPSFLSQFTAVYQIRQLLRGCIILGRGGRHDNWKRVTASVH